MSDIVTMDDSDLIEDDCIKMLDTFCCHELKVLLKGFATISHKHKYKNKEELRSSANQCLTKKGFKSNIWHLYHKINPEESFRSLRSNEISKVTDYIEFNDVSLNNDFKYLFTEFPNQINFKRLPFYNDISEVIKPTVLCKKVETIKFVLSSEQVNLVAANRSSRNNKNNYEFHIRICKIENASLNEVRDESPPGMVIHFSTGKYINCVSNTYIDCTDYIFVTPNINNTMIIKIPYIKSPYVFKMHLVLKMFCG